MARAIEEIDGRDAIRLIFSLDRLGRGGDHEPFYNAGLPAVRFTEPLEDYRHQHQTPRVGKWRRIRRRDEVPELEFAGERGARKRRSAAPARARAGAARNLKLTGGVTPDAKITWSADDDPERAGFEILWRETTEPRWRVYEFVPAGGESVLKGVSTDNHFFAVRSVGKNGARSIAVSGIGAENAARFGLGAAREVMRSGDSSWARNHQPDAFDARALEPPARHVACVRE